MASELPVVCSEEVGAGLVDGGFESGRDLIVAKNGEEFEFGVRCLLEAAELRDRLARHAYEKVRAAYSLEATTRSFERLLIGAATGELPVGRTLAPSREARIA